MTEEDIFNHFHDVKIDRDNIAHYRALAEGRLLINRCDHCQFWVYPHRPMCPECHGWELTSTEISGKGTLAMWTTIYQSRDPNNPIYEPVAVASVELAEQKGLRYLARIVDCPPEALRHDMPLLLVWIEEQGRRWPAFAPEVGA